MAAVLDTQVKGMGRRAALCFLVLSLLLCAREAKADEADATGSPYRLKWQYDAAIVAVSAALTLPAFIGQQGPPCYPSCAEPRGLLGIDHGVLGNYSPSAHMGANVVVASLVLAPLVINAFDSRFHGWLEDTFIFFETILASQAVTQLTKTAVGRPAPLLYADNVAAADYESPDAQRSFISGHTSTSFSAATAYSVTFWKRHPTSPMRFVVLGVSEAAALVVGMLKVKAGYHYPTDILGGALVGSGLGVLIPFTHVAW